MNKLDQDLWGRLLTRGRLSIGLSSASSGQSFASGLAAPRLRRLRRANSMPCYICLVRLAACLLIPGICFTASFQDEPVVKFGTTVVINSGFRGLVYHIRKGSQRLPDFHKLKPAGAIYTSALNVPTQSFRAGFPGVTKRFEWFAIDYTARFWIEKPGAYRFALVSDDGSRLYIDDN